MRAKLETKGFEEFLERITQMGKGVDQAAAKALEVGGDVLLAGMKRRVPKDTHNLEEHLVRSEPNQDGNFIYIEVGLAKDSDQRTVVYGTAQEYGTSSMAAQPYIRPTLDSDMGKTRVEMKKVLEEESRP